MDFKVLKSNDPAGEKAEALLRAGHKYPLTAKQKRIEEKKRKREQEEPRVSHNYESLRSNRNKRHEVEKYKEVQVQRGEEELNQAFAQKLVERNFPMVRKTGKNRLKRLKRKEKQSQTK